MNTAITSIESSAPSSPLPGARTAQPPESPPGGVDGTQRVPSQPFPGAQSSVVAQVSAHKPSSLHRYGAQFFTVPSLVDVEVSRSAEHVPFDASGTHEPAVQRNPEAQSAGTVHVERQPLGLHVYGKHAFASEALQAPNPSQTGAGVKVVALHASSPHLARAPWGGPTTAVQVPALPATSHASHWPSQALSQHTPSIHSVLMHSLPPPHAVPAAFLATHLPPPQKNPLAHSPSPVHPVAHAPAVHSTKGEHEARVPCGATPSTGEQVPAFPATSQASH
jgi:hypothetical protein